MSEFPGLFELKAIRPFPCGESGTARRPAATPFGTDATDATDATKSRQKIEAARTIERHTISVGSERLEQRFKLHRRLARAELEAPRPLDDGPEPLDCLSAQDLDV